jgi:alpha-tubulin suppressor-like RCC1 family protein
MWRRRTGPVLGLWWMAGIVGACGCPEEAGEGAGTGDPAPASSREPAAEGAPPTGSRPRAPAPPEHGVLALGAAHTCDAKGGQVRCRGSNRFGQLGRVDVPHGPGARDPRPGSVEGLEDVVSLAAGAFHTCALRRDGRVACWGHGGHGLTGDGRTGAEDVRVPVHVEGVRGAVALAAGDGFTCALRDEGGVVCWGRNDMGQLGRGSTGSAEPPGPVAGLEAQDAVVAGRQHACALSQGSVRCWGMAVDGQVGPQAGAAFVTTPKPVDLGGPVQALAAGGYHTCARMRDGGVRCMGANDSGQLGTGGGGRPDDRRPTPAPFLGVEAADALALGSRFSCVLVSGGGASCAGYNGQGQLGDGTTRLRRRAVPVQGLDRPRTLAAGSAHACAILHDGTITCWGANTHGQLGDGTTEGRPLPVTVGADPPR